MQVAGKLVVINPTQVVSEKFSLRKFVVETMDNYPQVIEMQVTQDKCSLLDAFQIGQQVNVDINLRGKSWQNPQGETKYFNTLEAWKIERVGGAPQGSTPPPVAVSQEIEDDGLPF